MQPNLKKILAREIVILFFSFCFIGLVFVALHIWNWKFNNDRERLELAISDTEHELSKQTTANIDFLHGAFKNSDLVAKEWSKDKLFEHLNDSVKCRALYEQVDKSDSLTDLFLNYKDFREVMDLKNELRVFEIQKTLSARKRALENELAEVWDSPFTSSQIESICIRLFYMIAIFAFVARYGYYAVVWAFRNY